MIITRTVSSNTVLATEVPFDNVKFAEDTKVVFAFQDFAFVTPSKGSWFFEDYLIYRTVNLIICAFAKLNVGCWST